MSDFFARMRLRHAAAVIIAVCVFLYINTLPNQLFWDDNESIVNNAAIKSFTHIGYIFTHSITDGAGVASNYYRPLLALSFALDYQIAGLHSWMYHVQSLLWHAAAGVGVLLCVYHVTRRKSAALAAALVWVAHPLQTEAVTYVAGRADPMHAALLLGALYLWMRVMDGARREFYIWSLILFSCALLVKERAIVFVFLPVLYFLYKALQTPRSERSALAVRHAQHFVSVCAIAGVYIFLRMTVFDFTDTFDPGAANMIGATQWWHYVLAYFNGIAIYARLIVFPTELSMEKVVLAPQAVTASVVFGVVVLVSTFGAVVCSLRKKGAVAFGVLFFGGVLFPSVYVYPIQGLLYEHWLYMPLVGLALIFGVVWSDFYTRATSSYVRGVLIVFVCVLVVTLGTCTIKRNSEWREPVGFYEQTIVRGGGTVRVYNNLGMAYDVVGRYDDAIHAYQKAIEQDGDIFPPWYNMGNAHREAGAYAQAHHAYEGARHRAPDFLAAYYNDAAIFVEEGDFDAAAVILKEARVRDTRNVATLLNSAVVELVRGDMEHAQGFLEQARAIAPQDPEVISLYNYVRAQMRLQMDENNSIL